MGHGAVDFFLQRLPVAASPSALASTQRNATDSVRGYALGPTHDSPSPAFAEGGLTDLANCFIAVGIPNPFGMTSG
jgi:hypothetical protein